MKKTVLIIYAQPEPTSVTRQLVEVTADTLEGQGHEIVRSDLYGMRWNAVYDEADFPDRQNPERLSFILESLNAYSTGKQTDDVVAEQAKLTRADAVILQFPLWWFGVPAILKGWIDRVYAFGFGYGYKDGTNNHRYGEGALKGKRALVQVCTGGPEADYGARGVNGPIDQLLFPLTHGALFYPGMDVLPTHTVYGAAHFATAEQIETAKAAWRRRVERLFEDAPIPFRSQNGGDYLEQRTLRPDVASGRDGFSAHIADE